MSQNKLKLPVKVFSKAPEYHFNIHKFQQNTNLYNIIVFHNYTYLPIISAIVNPVFLGGSLAGAGGAPPP